MHLSGHYEIALEANNPQALSLKKVFDELFLDVKIDSKFAKAVNKFQVEFINRNQDHLEFFGGNLIGVHVIRFKDSDVNRFFDEVLNTDTFIVKERVKEVNTIYQGAKITSDPLNLALMYLIHRTITSEYLVKDKASRTILDLGLIFLYRCVCALHNYFFKYPFDKKVAQEAYRRLSGKYLIKQLGSWYEVLEYRTSSSFNPKGDHYKALTSFTDDEAVVYALDDTQGRVKDILKNYAIEIYKVHEDGANIATTSSTTLDANGELTTRDKVAGAETKIQHLKSIVSDKDNFIRSDMMSVISKISLNSSPRTIKTTLNWMSDNYHNVKYTTMIDEFIEKTVFITLYFIEKNIPINKRRDTPYVLTTLKNLYLSTRTSDDDLLRIRVLGDKIVQASAGRVSKSLIQATRTAITLYISLRLLAE